MVHRTLAPSPYKIAPYTNFSLRPKAVYDFVENELGEEIIKDAYAAQYFNKYSTDSFSDIFLVHTHPSDIHICDIELSDNRSKVPIELGESRTYTGLHVFGDFIDNLKKTAKENNIQRISLLVAFPELYPVFRRYGFNVSETTMSKKAFRNAGTGFAMILNPYRK